MKIPSCCVLILSLIRNIVCDELLPPCSSEIYCHGPLLHTIQRAKIYEDSKTFVDRKMRFTVNQTLANFHAFMLNNTGTKNEMRAFVHDNFELEGQEFEDWVPDDWIDHPNFVDAIQDEGLRSWAVKLNLIWKDLGRKMKKEVEHNQDYYSIIWVPHPVIVPGGRFREFYYWDSYWIVQGLLVSEMHKTAKGMLENFLYIVDTYGHIPNGGRIYYLQRSQPPLMIPMIKSYLDFTNDHKFIEANIDIMEKEFDYWMREHTKTISIDGKNYTLATYGDKSRGPRPESYSEDIEGAEMFKDDAKKESFYSELKAAAESGWDFSSRWFINNATNKGNLTDTKTRSIVPVDLNAIIYWNAVILAEFHDLLGTGERAAYYRDIAHKWLVAVEAVLWHEEVGAWLDYDMQNSIKRDYFLPTNISPLWTGCYNHSEKSQIVRRVLKYLQNRNIMFPGGIPTTFDHTGEQWDYPNAWPPLQHMMVIGLNNTGDEVAQELAFEIAEKWIRTNFKAYQDTDAMFEKYDASMVGGHGTGGEYETQLGFGWTNGIVLEFLHLYANRLTAEDPKPKVEPLDAPKTAGSHSNYIEVIVLLISLVAGAIGKL